MQNSRQLLQEQDDQLDEITEVNLSKLNLLIDCI
jgi:hypothetical protein